MMPSPTRDEYQRWNSERPASASAIASAAPASNATSDRLCSGMALSISDRSSSGGIATIDGVEHHGDEVTDEERSGSAA